ncbi:hypothetical protein [Blastopirellula retiformator]|uniref:Uncharacterized protein n=1 Tax=Blastopirellula retiformator TaxID=2527970 RepID=A0A5C5VNQ9_9BACT|nr:hypothetical protein [Blastopirellula retiformator]TWT39555.1 hypothetical protein Enr8_12550 [Blastopirellula retiformator]
MYCGLVGLFLVQLNLIAIGGALGRGRWLIRMLWCLLAIVTIFSLFSLGAWVLNGDRLNSTFSTAMVYGMVLNASLIGIGLLAFRGMTGKRLAFGGAATATSARFSLRQLMVVTAILCATLAMLAATNFQVGKLRLLEFSILVPAGILAAMGLAYTIPALGIVFRKLLGRTFGFRGSLSSVS